MTVVVHEKLKVLLIDEDHAKVQGFKDALCETRYVIAHHSGKHASLLKTVDKLQPDLIVIDIESPSRDMLESLSTLSHFNPKPIVMFSTEQETEVITQSVQSGVSAYIVGDADPETVTPILDAAVAQFAQFNSLKTELIETKNQLDAKEVIDKAKRLLIKSKGLSEEQAFHSMRKMAMDSGQKMEDVAKTVVSLLDSFHKGARSV